MISKEILLSVGKNKGLVNKDHIEKDYFQDLILYNLYKRTNALVFKGGTALYKLYGLKRFSVDLDFTLIKDINILDVIKKVAQSLNAKIDVKKIKTSILFKLKFNGILTKQNTIRIDISLKNKVLKGFDVKEYVSFYIDIPPFFLRVLKLEEMIAEKIHSLLARKNARDLYDLFFLLRLSKFDKKLVEEKLTIFDMKFSLTKIKKEINGIKNLWEVELKPFILGDLPDFRVVKKFVLDRILS